MLRPEPSLQVSRDELSHDALNQRLQGGRLWPNSFPRISVSSDFSTEASPKRLKSVARTRPRPNMGSNVCRERAGRDLLQAKVLSEELSVRRRERGCRRHSAPQQPVFQQLGDHPPGTFCGPRLEGSPLLTSLLGVLEANAEGCRTVPTSH